MFPRKKLNGYEGEMRPFKMIGNLYYVGTYQACSHLIDTGDGLILIDTGYANTLYLVVHSIHTLGFNPKDIKYIINTHWHWDHTAGTAELAGLSGAKTLIGKDDFEAAKKYFTADITVKDGDMLSLGNTNIRFVETPGHTKGTISMFFDVTDGGKTYRVGTFGGAGANTLRKNTFEYKNARSDYFNSLNRLRSEKVDVFMANHTWNNDTEEKSKVLFETGENQFIDEALFPKFLDFCEARLKNIIAEENNL
ncbi:MAG: MBL fold metallo-hydrolase [Oscillospiraceae bacterium]|nr:MBL fold metallo-hydrolase [Oscillospiraceae bacterium]